jgi:uncharacterized protein (TIGR03382 family)
MQRLVAIAAVLGASVLAAASVGNGSVTASQPVLVIPIASGSGSGTDTLQNTTASPYQVDVDQDVSCAPGLTFSIAGGHPFSLAGSGTKNVALDCPAAQPGIARCLLHATNSTTGAALADFLQVCMVGASSTLAPGSTTVDFTATAVPVGSTAMLPLSLRNNGSGSIGKLYLQTSDLDGNFGFSLPCNLPAPFCDADITPIDPGNSATINVLCTPKTAGMHTARLYVATDSSQVLSQPVTLSCAATATATPVLDVNPPSVEVASPVEVLGSNASAVVHLTNAGSGTLLVNDISITDIGFGANLDWRYAASGHCVGQIHSACQLGPGDLVDLDVTFDPSQLGARNASLVVSYTDTTARSRAIPLDARAAGATLQLAGSPGPIDLGTVPVGRSSSLDFYVLNQGTRDTTANLSLTPSGAPFSLTPASSVDVAPTGTTKITATCTPTAAGSASTTITAESMDAFASPAIMLDATCTGTTQPLYAAPTALVFGEVRTTASPSIRTVMIASTGSPLTLSGQPMLETDNPAITLGQLSGTTTPATFDVTITPTAEGTIATHILVSDSAGETIQIPLTASIVKPAYELPPTLAIGTFCINQPTTPGNLQLTSKGTASITLQPPALTSTRSPFELSLTTPSAYPSELLPGQSAIVALTPHPQPAAGSQTDTLTWMTDVENAATATTTVTASFIDSGGAIAPSSLDFGNVVVHLTRDDAQVVVIQNCNGSLLDLDAPTIKAPFSIDGPSVPAQLQPNGTATFRIGFHPTELGPFIGTLLISSAQLSTPLMVTLVGEGVAGDPTVPDAGSSTPPAHHDTSFYACSCHATGVGGTAPILFAVVLVVARRRRRRVPLKAG